MRRIDYIVVHYTATYPDQELTAAILEERQKRKYPGASGGPYHWFIRRNGLLEVGREEWRVGAHTRGGYNANSIGIAWAGGVERDTGPDVGVNNMTPRQEAVLINKLTELTKQYPTARVVGHRDLVATQCPGFNVIPWWEKASQVPPVDVDNETEEAVKMVMQEYTEKLVRLLNG